LFDDSGEPTHSSLIWWDFSDDDFSIANLPLYKVLKMGHHQSGDSGQYLVFVCSRDAVLLLAHLYTRSVEGQTSDALWRLSSSSVTLHGGPVEFPPVRATACYTSFRFSLQLWTELRYPGVRVYRRQKLSTDRGAEKLSHGEFSALLLVILIKTLLLGLIASSDSTYCYTRSTG